MEFNEYETQCNEDCFKVCGQDVSLLSPHIAKITIHVPWAVNEPPTEERKTFVMNATNKVVNYLLAEGMIDGGGNGLGIMVETQSPQH